MAVRNLTSIKTVYPCFQIHNDLRMRLLPSCFCISLKDSVLVEYDKKNIFTNKKTYAPFFVSTTNASITRNGQKTSAYVLINSSICS